MLGAIKEMFSFRIVKCFLYLLFRDATKPINILTGLDYWLDNLICNVPELAMCYHTEGIVQVNALAYLLILLQRLSREINSQDSMNLYQFCLITPYQNLSICKA